MARPVHPLLSLDEMLELRRKGGAIRAIAESARVSYGWAYRRLSSIGPRARRQRPAEHPILAALRAAGGVPVTLRALVRLGYAKRSINAQVQRLRADGHDIRAEVAYRLVEDRAPPASRAREGGPGQPAATLTAGASTIARPPHAHSMEDHGA